MHNVCGRDSNSILDERKEKLPDDFQSKSLWERLYTKRSDIQSITHLDYSARIQTVHKETNPKYWELINEFKNLTGYGLVVNTSFNVRGEPIVCSPYDAYRCFMSTEMDFLVINNFVYEKTKQAEEARSYNSLIIAWLTLEQFSAATEKETTIQTKLI